MASRKKGESERMTFDKSLADSAGTLGVHIRPKATPGHVLAIKTFKYTGDQQCEISHGVLPFSLVPPGAVSTAARKQTAEDQQRADAFDANQYSDNVQGGVSIAEINKMRNSKGHAVTEWSETMLQLKAMLPMLGTLLGKLHPVTEAYQSFLRVLEAMETRLCDALQHKHGERLAAVLFVYHVQLKLHNWFEGQMEFGTPERMATPRFESSLDVFSEGGATYWMPEGKDVELIKPIIASRTTWQPVIGGDGAPALARGRAAAAPVAGERVVNNHRDDRLTGNNAIGTNVWTRTVAEAITRGGPPPVMNRNGNMVPTCVSWHGKGTCFDNCRRAADHGRHTNTEKEQFHAWCTQAFA